MGDAGTGDAPTMRAVTTDGAGGVVLATVPRPHPPVDGGLVRVRVCGLCGSDLEKLVPGDPLSRAAAGSGAQAGIVLGHEVVGLLERAGEAPVRVALAHHVPCGECALCRAGHSSLCSQFVTSALDPGGFAETLTVSALHLQDAVFELPPSVDDLTGTLLEPLSCVLRALDTAAGLAGAYPEPGVRGGGSGAPAGRLPRPGAPGEPPNVLVAGCGSVGLLFVSVLARSGAAGAGGDDVARLATGTAEACLPRGADGPLSAEVAARAEAPARPGAAASAADAPAGACAHTAVPALFAGARLHYLEPDPERAALAEGLGALPIHGSGRTASIDMAFVTAPAALLEVVAAMDQGGVVVVFAAGTAWSSAALDLDAVYRKEITLAGVRSGSPAHLRRALALLVEGRMPLEWFRPEVVGLEDLPEAVRRYRRGGALKVVVRP